MLTAVRDAREQINQQSKRSFVANKDNSESSMTHLSKCMRIEYRATLLENINKESYGDTVVVDLGERLVIQENELDTDNKRLL